MKKHHRKRIDFDLNCSEQVAKVLLKHMNSQNKLITVNNQTNSDIFLELKWEDHGQFTTDYIYEANIIDGCIKGELYRPYKNNLYKIKPSILELIQMIFYTLISLIALSFLPVLIIFLVSHSILATTITFIISSFVSSILIMIFTDHRKIHMKNLHQYLSPLVK